MVHLAECDLHNSLARFFQRLPDHCSLVRIRNRFHTDDRDLRSDIHHDIRVIDLRSVCVYSLEQDRRIPELFAEVLQYDLICPWGFTRVNDLMDPVQDHGAGPFQEQPFFLVMGEVHRSLYVKILPDRVKYLRTSLEPPVLSEHRVQDKRSVFMCREPVVGEHGIGCVRLRRIFDRDHIDSVFPEQFNIVI